MQRRAKLVIFVVTVFNLVTLQGAPGVYAQRLDTARLSQRTSSLPAAWQPSSACAQPDRTKPIAALTMQDRLKQGYPPQAIPQIDQIVHNKGLHYCSDTDRPRGLLTREYNQRQWSGNFADNTGNLTYIQLGWKESCTALGTNDAYATWAGIGGIGNNNLVQAGVDGVNSSVFSHYYEAWVMNYADLSDSGNVFSVNCGDSMWVEIGTGNCMYVADVTSGQTSGWRCFGPAANPATAECIVEAPTLASNGSVMPLSNYGTERLYSCDEEVNAGASVGIGTLPHDYYNMYDGGTLLSSTGSISGGDTYTMTWHNYY